MPETNSVVHWPLPGGGFSCPTCGAVEGITVALDLEDAGPDPSYMRCPDGHLWPEPCFPRLLGAGMLRRALEHDPEFLDRIHPLGEGLLRPRDTGWIHLPDGASGPDEQPIACPECRATSGLAAVYDSYVFDPDPSPMSCLNGHRWSEERFPRWAAADTARRTREALGEA
ncbi:hypothetical protein EJ357_22655 [Streptomyces cyaneochromogenes]|uniref:Uncharacterized protein n=1 Tax=Streptomyces cyaneochromogenes TaxID=2496836 RepID=A0A3S9M9S6_9ACTN|nr:hypothetical protein [Streptomyces cyaneochromogenes]AZQ35934.1 hypothetical protein EJ357_22655 [Streptomyces cyaneochromogenes]